MSVLGWGKRPRQMVRVLIVGAGEAAAVLVADIESNPSLEIVGLVDDDREKLGYSVGGHIVLGTTQSLPQLIRRRKVAEVFVALPSAQPGVVSRILSDCEACRVPVRVLPRAVAATASPLGIRDLRDVEIEDLLGRQTVDARLREDVASCFKDEKVLVTGAAGSIGSQLCRELVALRPKQILMLDNRETNLFDLQLELSQTAPGLTEMLIADIRDEKRIESVFRRHHPDSVLHAAAYKHVPLMEGAPEEAVKANVLGTRIVLEAAKCFGAGRFTLISTDKAVCPANVMGATKNLAELLITEAAKKNGTICSAVRFGNVLGSDGSVEPLFRQQILAGGPVTVTHPDATRYFISVEEAAYLVLQAHAYGEGGDVYILDMGEPVRIAELAKKMIALSGHEPDGDIKIVYCGLRPGEKLHEELSIDGQDLVATKCHGVMRLEPAPVAAEGFRETVEELESLALEADRETLSTRLAEWFPLLCKKGGGTGVERRQAPAVPDATYVRVAELFGQMPEDGLVATDEERILVALLRAGLDRRKGRLVLTRLPARLDWELLMKHAARHSLLPLIYHHASACEGAYAIPDGIRDRLKSAYYLSDIMNEVVSSNLRDIVEAFNGHGVDLMILKGAALLTVAYGRAPVRHIGSDIDILVREKDLAAAESIMLGLGYGPTHKSEKVRELFRTSHHHLVPFRNEGGQLVDVHRDLLPLPGILGFGMDTVWERARELRTAGGRAYSLSHEQMLLYLCAHSVFTDGNISLRQVMDVAQLVKARQDEIDWDLFGHYLDRSPVRHAAVAMMSLSREVANAPVPERFAQPARRSIMEDRLVAVMKSRVFRGWQRTLPPPVVQLLFLQGPDKLRLARKLLVPHPFHQIDAETESRNRVRQGVGLAREYGTALFDIATANPARRMQDTRRVQ